MRPNLQVVRQLVNKRNTRTRCEICSKLTIKTYFTPCSNISIVNFEHVIAGFILHITLMNENAFVCLFI